MISWLPHEIITRHTWLRTRGRRTAPLKSILVTNIPPHFYTELHYDSAFSVAEKVCRYLFQWPHVDREVNLNSQSASDIMI